MVYERVVSAEHSCYDMERTKTQVLGEISLPSATFSIRNTPTDWPAVIAWSLAWPSRYQDSSSRCNTHGCFASRWHPTDFHAVNSYVDELCWDGSKPLMQDLSRKVEKQSEWLIDPQLTVTIVDTRANCVIITRSGRSYTPVRNRETCSEIKSMLSDSSTTS